MVAGKGAGTIAAQTHFRQVTNFTKCREAVGLSCSPRPQRRLESRGPRSSGQGNRRPPRDRSYRQSQRKAPASKPHLRQCYALHGRTPQQRLPARVGEEGDTGAAGSVEVWECETGVAGGEGGGGQGVEGVVEESELEEEDLHGALGNQYGRDGAREDEKGTLGMSAASGDMARCLLTLIGAGGAGSGRR